MHGDELMKNTLTKILAGTGTALVWFPLLAPVLLSVILLITEGVFRLDYLIPAELFPLAGGGGILLVWAALRARLRKSSSLYSRMSVAVTPPLRCIISAS